MPIKFYIRILLIIISLPFCSAQIDYQSSESDDYVYINFKVIPYGLIEYEYRPLDTPSYEYMIVGDSFYYTVNIKSSSNLTDKINISVLSPDKRVIHSEAFDLELKENIENVTSPKNFKNKGNVALPLDLAGDYEIKVCSEKGITFRREYRVFIEGYSAQPKHIWYTPCISYYFDVIPQWQYKIYSKQNEQNRINEALIQNSSKISLYSLIIAFIAVLIQIVQTLSTSHGRNAMNIFVKGIVLLLMLVSGLGTIWISTHLNGISAVFTFLMGIALLYWSIVFVKS